MTSEIDYSDRDRRAFLELIIGERPALNEREEIINQRYNSPSMYKPELNREALYNAEDTLDR